MAKSIFYFCTEKHSYPLGRFVEFHSERAGPSVRIIPYPKVFTIRDFPSGVFVFTDFERVSEKARNYAAHLFDALAANGNKVLNHPLRALRRFDLLRMLHKEGINDFNVYRVHEWQSVRRFPVFIRKADNHGAPATDLIKGRAELRDMMARVAALPKVPEDLIIVEFGNAPGPDGRYRKYSAYRVGDTYYAQHLFCSSHWWIKYAASDPTEEEIAEHFAYVESNPHRDQLEKIFTLANIEYGRIDYCVVNGRVQVFEINTNPVVVQPTEDSSGKMKRYASLHDDALMALLDGAGGEATPNPLFSEEVEERTPEAVNADILQAVRNKEVDEPVEDPRPLDAIDA